MSELAVIQDAQDFSQVDISKGYSSIKGNDLETRKKVYTAVTNAASLGDNLGKTIQLVDIIVQPVESVNEGTGMLEQYSRTTFIDAEGNAYAAGSDGVLTATRTLLAVMGQPSTWAAPLPVKVVEKKGNKGFKFYTVELA